MVWWAWRPWGPAWSWVHTRKAAGNCFSILFIWWTWNSTWLRTQRWRTCFNGRWMRIAWWTSNIVVISVWQWAWKPDNRGNWSLWCSVSGASASHAANIDYATSTNCPKVHAAKSSNNLGNFAAICVDRKCEYPVITTVLKRQRCNFFSVTNDFNGKCLARILPVWKQNLYLITLLKALDSRWPKDTLSAFWIFNICFA